ncbi:MAG: chromate transporter [Treponema sp.]|jgi:chromate transporter|nr:chromate transporter [Treponema sp.]
MNPLLLFAEFFKIGLFSVGGGLATLPFLFHLADIYGWLTREKVGDILAVAQSSPGAIGINMGAQTGFQALGIAGSIIAVLGMIVPSIVIILVIAKFLKEFKENSIVAAVFTGLRPAAAGLLAAAAFGAWKLALYNSEWQEWYTILRYKECLLCAGIFIALKKLKFHPVVYIALGGAAGIMLGL